MTTSRAIYRPSEPVHDSGISQWGAQTNGCLSRSSGWLFNWFIALACTIWWSYSYHNMLWAINDLQQHCKYWPWLKMAEALRTLHIQLFVNGSMSYSAFWIKLSKLSIFLKSQMCVGLLNKINKHTCKLAMIHLDAMTYWCWIAFAINQWWKTSHCNGECLLLIPVDDDKWSAHSLHT